MIECTHPDHVDGTYCIDRAIGCHKECKCCMLPWTCGDCDHFEYTEGFGYEKDWCTLDDLFRQTDSTESAPEWCPLLKDPVHYGPEELED